MKEEDVIALARVWYYGRTPWEAAQETGIDIKDVIRIAETLDQILVILRPIIQKRLVEAIEDL